MDVKKVYTEYIDTSSTKATVTNYSKLANDYEKDFVGCGYTTPRVVAKTALEYLIGDIADARVLDICCGTGLVADGLRVEGFSGAIDGVDASEGMLEVARSKSTYRHLTSAFITPDKKLDVQDSLYNAVVCCGGFGPGHLSPDTLQCLVEATNQNGVVVFATRFNEAANTYVEQLEKEISHLESAGRIAVLSKQETTYFDVDFHKKVETGITQPLLATIYCCKKL